MLNHLQQIICFSLDVHIWSGRKKLTAADLNLENNEIPPEELASLGAKKICHPVLLAPFHTLRRRAERTCEAVGVRFLGGYAIPEEKAEEVALELEQIAQQFEAEKEEFLKTYAINIQAWVSDFQPRWRKIISPFIESTDHVANRLSFGFQTFQVTEVEKLNSGLQKAANGLGKQLCREISKAARLTWSQSFQSRTKVSQKALRPIRAIINKANGLAFINPKLSQIIAGIEQELDNLPKSGYIEGHDFHALVGILNTLADLDSINTVEAEQTEEEMPPPEGKEEDMAPVEGMDKEGKIETHCSEIDIENIFEPISEFNQNAAVSRPVAWF